MPTLIATAVEQRYSRLLQSYPANWRARHGEALLGVLLDRAEGEGRTNPTVVESVDLVSRGLWTRLIAGDSLEVRGRMASTSAGIGLGFALIYTSLGLVPSHWPGPQATTVMAGPALNLAAWTLLGIVSVLQLPSAVRLVPQLAVLLAPCLVLSPSYEIEGTGKYFPLNGWVQGNDANAAFLLALALLSAIGPLHRRHVPRAILIGTPLIALALLVAANGWSDPYNQTLWAATDRYSTPTPGTLASLWPGDSGQMPLATGRPPAGMLFKEWVRSTFGQLNLVPIVVLGVALTAGTLMRRRGRRVVGTAVLALSGPVLAAVLVAALRPTGIWFQ